MTFEWRDFLVLAEELAVREEESCQRSAVSRAYYAAFCSARDAIREEGVVLPKSGSVHRVIWSQFEKASASHRRRIAILGSRLRHSRNRADYDVAVARVEDVAADAIADAGQLISLLEEL